MDKGTLTTQPAPRVVALLLAERRRIAMAFRAAKALSPDRAATLETLAVYDDALFEDMIRLGVVRQTAQRTYWFDERSYMRTIERPRFHAWGVLSVLAILLLFVWTLYGVFTA